MNYDNDRSHATGLQRYQFSLKALLLAVLCFSVAGAMATWQRDAFAAAHMETPIWLFVCFLGWNAAIACQFAFATWGWITLWQFAADAVALAGDGSMKDSDAGQEYLGLRRVYLVGVAWGALSFVLWLSFAIMWLSRPSQASDEGFAAAFCFTVWHLVPWTIVSYLRFALRSRWRKTGPIAAMRLAAFVGVAAPATGFAAYVLLQ
ncbi:MAG: hypothetical protein H8E44_24295 [Planctomycetes bacterium]|nr:hypothetical protein [Planctomycetota bacterium]MBL7042822.1 hypothetical protein [Pirellulaceae bacterium]